MNVFFNVYTLGAVALGYLLGSIPFGYLLTRAAGLGDVRAIGSGNIGATNVLRTGHKSLAALTLLLDGLKGTIAVLVGHWIGAQGGVAILAALLAGLGAFLGHVFPAWLNFRGGKGVATYIGVLLAAYWPGALIFCAVWLLLAFLTRYSSLSALIASVVTPAILLIIDDKITNALVDWQPGLHSSLERIGAYPAGILGLVMTLLLLYKHRANIRRLASGEEPKIGARA
jgi:acyl phosphate:glycerol-3-phosphate acyltransferase